MRDIIRWVLHWFSSDASAVPEGEPDVTIEFYGRSATALEWSGISDTTIEFVDVADSTIEFVGRSP